MMKILNKKKFFLFWAILVFILIAWPMPEGVEAGVDNSDKIIHFFLFGIFAYLLSINLKEKYSKKRSIAISFIISSLYAYSTEILQNFIPGRTYSLFDWFAGIAGVSIFLIIFYARKK